MQIYDKRLDEIKPYENNPRHNDNAVDAVANSIREFGFKVPIVVDSEGVIVAGHTRYKAAQKLGLQTVPCLVADDLNEEQINAFRLADNKVGELATWDLDTLKVELDNIGDIDLSGMGFDLEDVVTGDGFGTDFELPSGDKSEFCQMTFHVHEAQKTYIQGVCDAVKQEITETYGNPNENGNALYEVCRQWAELKKLK